MSTSSAACTYKVASLNINGIAAPMRIRMLGEFLSRNDIDLMCVQEVTNSNIEKIKYYEAHVNTGEGGRGTAFLVKEEYTLTDIRCIPSGRGISANFHWVQLDNIYAPSGASRRRERKEFYNKDVPRLILRPSPTLLLTGDFNCIIGKLDCTGTPALSRALRSLVDGMDLQDTWTRNELH
jgi:exonuclease III